MWVAHSGHIRKQIFTSCGDICKWYFNKFITTRCLRVVFAFDSFPITLALLWKNRIVIIQKIVQLTHSEGHHVNKGRWKGSGRNDPKTEYTFNEFLINILGYVYGALIRGLTWSVPYGDAITHFSPEQFDSLFNVRAF